MRRSRLASRRGVCTPVETGGGCFIYGAVYFEAPAIVHGLSSSVFHSPNVSFFGSIKYLDQYSEHFTSYVYGLRSSNLVVHV